MKRSMKRVLGVCLIVGLMAAQAVGQTKELVRFHADQEINVNGVTLPAGAYTIRDTGSDNGAPLLLIRSDEGAQAKVFASFVAAPAAMGAAQSSVTLRHDGSAYRIERIFVAGPNVSYQVLPGSAR